MKLLHEITDTTFDMDTAYQTLSVTFNLSNLLSNVLKMMAYSGLTLKRNTVPTFQSLSTIQRIKKH